MACHVSLKGGEAMKKKCKILICMILGILGGAYGDSGRSGELIPEPKEMKLMASPVVFPKTYRVRNTAGVPESQLKRLRGVLEYKLGWRESQSGEEAVLLEFIKKPGTHSNPEFYTLDVTEKGIVLGSVTSDGMKRAMGRLTGLIDSPLVKISPGTMDVVFPRLSIRDWPDFPVRAVKLEMMDLPQQQTQEQWLAELRKTLDTIASLGFNKVFLELGGRVQSLKYPEISLPRAFSLLQVRGVVEYAEACGLEVFPMINSIGHMKRAPQIFPLYGEDGRGNRVPRAMNLGHPDFYTVYLDYLDELLALFGKPAYLMICTDEFHKEIPMLEKATGSKFKEFYPAFLNSVNRWLKARGTRLMITHDMLLARDRYSWPREEGNAPDGIDILPLIDKDIAIGYWNYEYGDYPFLNDLAAAGFKDLWLMPWYKVEAVRKLSRRGWEIHAKMFGTAWWIYPHHQGYPQQGVFFWNIQKNMRDRDVAFFDRASDRLFYSRGTKIPVLGAATVKMNGSAGTVPSQDFMIRLRRFLPDGKGNADGVPFDFNAPRGFYVPGVTPPAKLPRPWDFKALVEKNQLRNLLFEVPGSTEYFQSDRTVLNCKREIGMTVIYTPDYGISSRTNSSGHEFAVANGKIAALSGRIQDLYSEEKGNMRIPENGFVVSKHGSRFSGINTRISGAFNHNLKIGAPLELRLRPVSYPSVREWISAELDGNKMHTVIFMTVAYPVLRERELGTIRILGGVLNEKLVLNSKSFFNSWCSRFGAWHVWMPWSGLSRYGLKPILALEWQCPEKMRGQPLIFMLVSANAGVEAGLTVLGIVQYD